MNWSDQADNWMCEYTNVDTQMRDMHRRPWSRGPRSSAVSGGGHVTAPINIGSLDVAGYGGGGRYVLLNTVSPGIVGRCAGWKAPSKKEER